MRKRKRDSASVRDLASPSVGCLFLQPQPAIFVFVLQDISPPNSHGKAGSSRRLTVVAPEKQERGKNRTVFIAEATRIRLAIDICSYVTFSGIPETCRPGCSLHVHSTDFSEIREGANSSREAAGVEYVFRRKPPARPGRNVLQKDFVARSGSWNPSTSRRACAKSTPS